MWVAIKDQVPKPAQRVYVACENTTSQGTIVRYQTMAQYVPPMTIPEDDFMDDEYLEQGDYDETTDTYFTPEGFYEWQSESDTHWKITSTVTHWMPLLELPKVESIQNQGEKNGTLS